MATLIALPILGLAVLIQVTILSRVTLLHGPADLVLITLVSWVLQDRVESIWPWVIFAGFLIGYASALPTWLVPIAYVLVTVVVLFLKRRVWQVPILALFTAIFFGTVIVYGLSFGYLTASGVPLNFQEAFNLFFLPSLLLNLLLAIPIYGLMSEIAKFVYPVEIEA